MVGILKSMMSTMINRGKHQRYQNNASFFLGSFLHNSRNLCIRTHVHTLKRQFTGRFYLSQSNIS